MVSRVGVPHPPPVLPNLVRIFDLYLYVPLSECMSCYFRRGVSNEDAGRKGAGAGNYRVSFSAIASLSLSLGRKQTRWAAEGRALGDSQRRRRSNHCLPEQDVAAQGPKSAASRSFAGGGKLCSAFLVNSVR